MERIKKIFLIILIIPAILFSCSSSKRKYSDTNLTNSFEVTISLDKETYIEGENVWLRIIFKNISSRIDSIAMLYDDKVIRNIKIVNENGMMATFKGSAPFLFEKTYIKFQPGEEKEFYAGLRHSWGFKKYDMEHVFPKYYFPKEKYNVSLEIDVDGDKRENITSNKVMFTVEKPEGFELEAFSEMIRIFKMPFNGTLGVEGKERVIDEYIKFVGNYTNSVYLEEMFLNSLGKRKIGKTKYDESFIDYCMIFIEQRPNSPLIGEAVGGASNYYLYELGDKDKAIQFLESLNEIYPNTRVSKEVERILSTEEYKDDR
jgi:hypothetical protein